MGAPNIGGDLTGAVTADTGDIIGGDLDDIGFLSGNNDDTYSITVVGTYGTASINATTGEWAYDLDDSHPAVQALGASDTLQDVFTVRMEDDDGDEDFDDVTITISGAVCFVAGTLIETDVGARRIETLHPGDNIQTLDHGLQVLQWVGKMELAAPDLGANPKLVPVRIAAGALGQNLPKTDLYVSRQHRILASGPECQAAFGTDEVLVPAIQLVGLPGIDLNLECTNVTYYHLLFDEHEVVFGNGAPSESFLTGQVALNTLPLTAQAEIASLFPETQDADHSPEPARALPQSGKQCRVFRENIMQSGTHPLSSLQVPLAAQA